MSAAQDTVHDRFDRARTTLTAGQIATGLGLVAAIAFTLLVLQDPAAHDSLHNFRHAAGVVCH
ncbi:CbtB-domain containing protein [Halorubellus sp. JP-L1]|uniref:CbtB domain-containing protein n=1 Tax=Halorubellus sp. JP-L1 TaxID=2715753 RepID=UPI001409148B|nr:CbtB domain-containing protein [Halorubellus sp. JP-L1]NHN41676.1 CbtB-domain containing protein [Halorubellus sp. JP-L1]